MVLLLVVVVQAVHVRVVEEVDDSSMTRRPLLRPSALLSGCIALALRVVLFRPR